MGAKSGYLKIFAGKSLFSAAQIDSAYDSKEIADQDTGTDPVDYTQLKPKGEVMVSRNGETIDLENNVDGLIDIAISARDDWKIEFELAKIDFAMLYNLFALDPSGTIDFDTVLTGLGGKLDYVGASLLNFSFPIILQAKSYDPSNTGDEPKFGTGSDPLSFCFFKVAPATREMALAMDANKQTTIKVVLKPVAVDGATNKGVAYAFGALTSLA